MGRHRHDQEPRGQARAVHPVRCCDEVVAVVTRESAMTSGRRPGELERHYLDVFERLARMIAEGTRYRST